MKIVKKKGILIEKEHTYEYTFINACMDIKRFFGGYLTLLPAVVDWEADRAGVV
jgi:hypothetical protein